ncbi:hypothetical protein OH809_18325 [Streptomyces sp. NBC_00873]|uniref:hypothetical protein n=1 Tax=unclassified Streptomyces TaxID=2593676 RepID=UPI00386EFBAC|nr:hypothetical protein OH809_18325 [Streptomyces sp. NBC_00873]WTA45529.1 hypothetical protein OH821_25360 [Streptomyces sp. NBC_00842]
MMRQHLKLSAVLVAVVLALTGFSTSSHAGKSRGSKSHGSSSSGGGCSNSKKSNGSYHHNDYDDDDYDDSSSSSSGGSTYETATPGATATDTPQVTVVRCAHPSKGKRRAVTASTVRLTAVAYDTHMYDIDVTFLDAAGNTVDTGEASVEVDGGASRTISVRMDTPGKVSRVKKCRAEATLSY